MAGDTESKSVKQYEPGDQGRVELKNGRIVDVVHDRYHDAGTRVILQSGVIVSMPGLAGDPVDVTPDYSINLEGRTVLPGLFNTHCHLVQFELRWSLACLTCGEQRDTGNSRKLRIWPNALLTASPTSGTCGTQTLGKTDP